MFKVGQKVVCIREMDRRWWADALCIEMPVKGEVYTVRRIVQRPIDGDTGAGIMLEEILNMPVSLTDDSAGGYQPSDKIVGIDETAFWVGDFRPLITVEQFATAKKTVDA